MRYITTLYKKEDPSFGFDLRETIGNMVGKKVTLIDTSSYMLRLTGTLSLAGDTLTIRKSKDRAELLLGMIETVSEYDADSSSVNLRFTLTNGRYIDLIY